MKMLMRRKEGAMVDEPEAVDNPTEEKDDYAAAAREIIDAIHSNDEGTLAEALKNFVSACS